MAVKLGSAFVEILADTKGLRATLVGLRSQMGSILGTGKVFTGVGADIAALGAFAGATATKFYLLGRAVQEFVGYQSEFAKSTSIMLRLTGEERKSLDVLAKETAKTYGLSLTRIAEAYRAMTAAGFSVADIQKTLGTLVRFSIVGNMELSEAIQGVSDAMRSMGIWSQDATTNYRNLAGVTDMLTMAEQLSNASVKELMQSLARGGIAVKDFGQDIEETMAVLSAFAAAGRKGNTGGQSLVIAIREMQESMLKRRGLFKALTGQDPITAKGEFIGLSKGVIAVSQAVKKLRGAEREKFLEELFPDSRARHFIITLFGLLEDNLENWKERLRNAAGINQTIWQRMLDTDLMRNFMIVLQKMNVLMQQVFGESGSKIVPIVKALGGAIDYVTATLQELSPIIAQVVDTILKFGGTRILARLGIHVLIRGIRLLYNELASIGTIGPLWEHTFGRIPLVNLLNPLVNAASALVGAGIVSAAAEADKEINEFYNAIRRNSYAFLDFFTSFGRVLQKILTSMMAEISRMIVVLFGLGDINVSPNQVLSSWVDKLGEIAAKVSVIMTVWTQEWSTVWETAKLYFTQFLLTIERGLYKLTLYFVNLQISVSNAWLEIRKFMMKLKQDALGWVDWFWPGGSDLRQARNAVEPAELIPLENSIESWREYRDVIIDTISQIDFNFAANAENITKNIEDINKAIALYREKLATEPLEAPEPSFKRPEAKAVAEAAAGSATAAISSATRLPIFTQFAEMARQIQESVAKDDLGTSMKEVAVNTKDMANKMQEQVELSQRLVNQTMPHQPLIAPAPGM